MNGVTRTGSSNWPAKSDRASGECAAQLCTRDGGLLGVHNHGWRAAHARPPALQRARVHAGPTRFPFCLLRVLRDRHESSRRVSGCPDGPQSDDDRWARPPGRRSRSPRFASARLERWRFRRLRDGGAGAVRHRQGSHQDERQVVHQGAHSGGEQGEAVQVGRGIDGEQECPEGRRLLRGQPAPRVARLQGCAGRYVCGALVVFVGAQLSLPSDIGRTKAKAKFKGLFSKNREVNVLSAARFFLFGARDVWFVVGVPVFLYDRVGWDFMRVGAFLALWVVGYGIVQSFAPFVVRRWTGGRSPGGRSVAVLAFLLAGVTAAIGVGLSADVPPMPLIVGGLAVFGLVFAINSAVHSYMILAYSEGDKVAMNVGFYYMSNAGGRLAGTVLSGVLFQHGGVAGCLWGSVVFAASAGVLSLGLRREPAAGRSLATGV